jgi:hypothetical protein
MGTGGIASPLLNLGAGWRWSASHICNFNPGDRAPWYPLHRRLGGPESQSGLYEENKNLLLLSELNLGCPAHSLVAIPTKLSQFLLKYVPSSYVLLINGASVDLYSSLEFNYPALKMLR